MEYKLFLDTNALLNLKQEAFKEDFVISQKTLEEIENIKTSDKKDGEVKHSARMIAHLLDDNYGRYEVVKTDDNVKDVLTIFNLDNTPDNIILAAAYYYNKNVHPIIVCTDDINCKFISKNIFQLETKSVNDINLVKNINEYTGYKDVTLSDEEMSYFYLHLNENIYSSVKNEYLIIRKSDNEIVDYRKWNGKEYKALSFKQINSKFFGKFKPRNPQQVLSFDMIQDKNTTIKILTGRFGSGKDAIMITNALDMIDHGDYDKLIYVRNAIGVKDASDIGYLPGSKLEKMLPYAMPLADHLGGEIGLEEKIEEGVIEVEYLGHMRGRDIRNSIIYVSEAENLTKEHVQLLIGRVGEGSVLWMNGDFKQTDSPIFRINNGLISAVQKLAGHEKFGYVQLQKTERSETAAMADLLD